MSTWKEGQRGKEGEGLAITPVLSSFLHVNDTNDSQLWAGSPPRDSSREQDLESVFSKSQVGESFQLKARLGNHSQFQWALSAATSWTLDQDNPRQTPKRWGRVPTSEHLSRQLLPLLYMSGNSSQRKLRGESGCVGQHSACCPESRSAGLGVCFLGFRRFPDQPP